jgi:hypothetical protein
MKPPPSKTLKAIGGKKRAREEAAGSAAGTSPPVSPPRPNPNQEWKKSKAKTEDLLALLNSGFLRDKEVDMWRAVAGDPYPMEKSPDEIPMFTRFAERGLSLPASDFFKGPLGYYDIEYLNLNPNGIFHTSVFVHFCEAFLGIKPHWILFRKFFRVKPQPSVNNPRVVGGAGIQMREDATEQYLSYKLIDSNQDWKAKWFYVTNHHPGLPKPSGKQPKHRLWWNSEPTMQEGIQLPELLAKIKALREAGLRAEHVAFSFMKRRVQPLMARDTLGYQYTGDDDTSRMPGDEVDDDDIVDRLGRIFKDMPAHTPCPVPEYSAARPTNKVRAVPIVEYSLRKSSRADVLCFLQDDLVKFVSEPASPPQLVEVPEEGKAKAKERRDVGEGDDTVVIEDTSEEDDDEETLQERFQLRSRSSRPGLPHIPLVQDPPTSLEASLPAPPRRPRNVARKRVAKKLKVTETTSQEVSRLE